MPDLEPPRAGGGGGRGGQGLEVDGDGALVGRVERAEVGGLAVGRGVGRGEVRGDAEFEGQGGARRGGAGEGYGVRAVTACTGWGLVWGDGGLGGRGRTAGHVGGGVGVFDPAAGGLGVLGHADAGAVALVDAVDGDAREDGVGGGHGRETEKGEGGTHGGRLLCKSLMLPAEVKDDGENDIRFLVVVVVERVNVKERRYPQGCVMMKKNGKRSDWSCLEVVKMSRKKEVPVEG